MDEAHRLYLHVLLICRRLSILLSPAKLPEPGFGTGCFLKAFSSLILLDYFKYATRLFFVHIKKLEYMGYVHFPQKNEKVSEIIPKTEYKSKFPL